MALRVVPVSLAAANALVARLHRHHGPVQGHRFSLGCLDGDRLCGAAVCGRPVARMVDQDLTLEVTRLVTDGTRCACSILYAAAARAAQAMGYERVQTYVLASEPGTSLRAAGWRRDGETIPRSWSGRPGRAEGLMVPKVRWARDLHPPLSPVQRAALRVEVETPPVLSL